MLPGITGSLIYPASADAARCRLEAALLYWGQWLGLGQKTTLWLRKIYLDPSAP
ncbi:MAG: hypothetical protein IPG57_16980 [Burkholderiales bacterium]|nr:hypothetical protein [Burkholderiales bacterium]